MTNLSGLCLLCSAPFPRSTKERRYRRSSGPTFAARSGQPGRDRQTHTHRRRSPPASSREARPAARGRGPAAARGRANLGGEGAAVPSPAGRPPGGRAGGTGLGEGGRQPRPPPLQEEGRLPASCPLHLSPLAYLGHFVCLRRACVPRSCVSPPQLPPARPRTVPSGRGLLAGRYPGSRGRALPVAGRAGQPGGRR